MKTKIIAVITGVLLLNLTAFSLKPKNNAVPVTGSTKEVALDSRLRHLSVDANIQVVLVTDDSKASVTIAGKEDAIGKVSISFINNEMVISSKKYVKQGSIVVYVPAKDLTYVTLGKGSSVSAPGLLKNRDLTVELKEGSRVDLKTFGNINVKENDCDVVYERLEKIK